MRKFYIVLFVLLIVGVFSSKLQAEEKTGILTHFETMPRSVDCPEGCTLACLYDGDKTEMLCFQKYHPYIFFKENEGKEMTFFFQKKEDKLVLMAVEFRE